MIDVIRPECRLLYGRVEVIVNIYTMCSVQLIVWDTEWIYTTCGTVNEEV